MSDLPDIPLPSAGQGVVVPDGVVRAQATPEAAPDLHGGVLFTARPEALKRISRRESGDKAFVGYTPPGEKQVDLSKAPLDDTGFPIWSGRMGPEGMSHAAGLYQIQPGTWQPIARELGITDFSEGSQHRVAEELYKREGSAPWAASAGGKGEGVVAGKRELLSDDLPEVPVPGAKGSLSDAGSVAAGTEAEALTSEDQIATAGTPEYSRASAALLHGIQRGLVEPPLAIAQITMPRETMEPLEARLRSMESEYADLRDEHPTLEMVGRLTGATVSIMAGARLLGAVAPMMMPAIAAKAAQAAWQGVGAVGRGAATGTAVGSLNFYERGAEGESRPFGINARAFDTGVGSVLGLIGGTVARSLEWGARNISDTAYGRSFMRLVQQTTNGTARNTGQAQDNALSYYGQVTTQSRQNYAVRNAAGREIEGFPTGVGPTGVDEGFSQGIDNAVQTSKDAGVKSWVEGVARSVKKTLGVEAEESKFAEWQRLQTEYETRIERAIPAGLSGAARQQAAERYAAAGGATPPPAFVTEPIKADAYAQARTEINAAITRAVRSNNSAVETQLKMMLRGVDEVVENAAVKDGVSRAAFVRQREAADKYFKETVVPLRRFFDGKPFERVTQPVEQGGMTTAAVYDNIAKVVAKDDVELARALGRTLGPRGRDSMVQVMAAEALRTSELGGEKGTAKAIDYVMKHQNVIREFIGRDAFTELMGMAKVAGVLTERVQARSPKIFGWEHSVAPVFALSAIMSGHYAHAGKLMLVLPAYHIGMAALQRIHQTPVAKALMRTAARMKPGSAELESLVDRTENVIRKTTVIGDVGAGQEMRTRQ